MRTVGPALDFRRLRGIISENLTLKLLSFTFALILYSLVHGAQDAQKSVSVGLLILPPPDTANRMLTSPVPPQVRVTLRGSRSALDELHTDDLESLKVDVRSGTEKRVTFDPQAIRVPGGIHVQQIDPPALDLVWEDQIVRDVPVQVGVVASPAVGYVVKGAPVAEPPTVRVRGPRSEVLVLQHARTDGFDVAGLTEGTYSRALAVDKPTGRLSYDVQSVMVTVEIGREVVERPFTKLSVAVVGQAKGKTQPSEVDVRLVCPPEIVRALRPEQVVPHVEVKSSATTGSEVLPVKIAVDRCEAHATPSSVIVKW